VTAAAAVLLPSACSRTIEEEEPRELVEHRIASHRIASHRIEPCRKWCEPMLSPECGVWPEEVYGRTIDGCVEDCAAAEPGGWDWGRQADGTDPSPQACHIPHVDGTSLSSREAIEQVLLDVSTATAWRVTVARRKGSSWVALEHSITRVP